MMPYGEPWRVRRGLFKQNFNISNAQIYQVPEIKYIHQLLVNLAQRPADFLAHVHQYVLTADPREKLMSIIDRMTGSVAISMTYGVDIRPIDDPNLQVARLANEIVIECLITGSTTVDLFPLLKYVPSWVPGASFHEKAKVSRQYAKLLREGLYSEGKNKMVISLSGIYISETHWHEPNHPELQANKGVEHDSLLSLSLKALNPESESQDNEIIKDVAANVYMGITFTINIHACHVM